MSALLRKEVRLILPAWIVAMILAILPGWLVWSGSQAALFQGPGMHVFAPFGLGVLLLCVTPFGQELSWGTFSLLLAQPVPRRRLWRAKATVLAVALGLAFLAFCVSNHFRLASMLDTANETFWLHVASRPGGAERIQEWVGGIRRSVFHDTLMFGGLSALAAFAGGLWATLLFRQVSAALWFAFLIPMGLSLGAGKILSYFPDRIADAGMVVVIGLYSVAGFLWARRLFLQAQDVQWTGGVISLPAWRGSAAKAQSAAWQPKRKPLRAMIRKEFQSHHINLILAGGLLLVHLAAIVIRKFGAGYFFSHRSVALMLESVPLLWLVLPLLVGSVAVAEERKLGTLEGFLCLPTPRRLQFIVKFAVALVIGVLFGGVAPLTIERLGTVIGLPFNNSALAVGEQGRMLSATVVSLLGSAGLTVLALFASTLTRNTLQAMGAALAAAAFACGLIAVAARPPNIGDIILWRGALIGLVGCPMMLAAVLALGYGNYKRVHVGPRIWFRNLFTLLLMLAGVAVATTTIYHRAWESWTPEEPTHLDYRATFPPTELRDPATRESWRSRLPKLESALSRMAVIRDGRLWLRRGQLKYTERGVDNIGHKVVEIRGTGPWHTGFVEGSDWREVAVTEYACFAIQGDGSLWDLSHVQPGKAAPASSAKAFGESRDWKKLSGGAEHFLALKRNGTIWEWGRRYATGPAGVNKPAPVRIGSDADWTAVCEDNNGALSLAIKSDGSIWRFGARSYVNTNKVWETKTIEQPERWLTGPARPAVSISRGSGIVAVVYDDGSLWIGSESFDSNSGESARHELVRRGNDSDWLEVRLLDWIGAVGIKWDGSLWQWKGPGVMEVRSGRPLNPTMASQYFVWTSACVYGKYGKSFLTLAADGSVCLWGDPYDRGYFSVDPNEPDPRMLLLPSRIKARKIAALSH